MPSVERINDCVFLNHDGGRSECLCGAGEKMTENIHRTVLASFEAAGYVKVNNLITNSQQEEEEPLTLPVFNYAREGHSQYSVVIPPPDQPDPLPVIGNADPGEEPLTLPVFNYSK